MNTRGAVALCAALVLLLAGCARQQTAESQAADEVAKLRSGLASTVPSTESTAPLAAPSEPAALASNPIYRVKLTSPRCAEPQVEPTSLTNVRTYYTQFVACLNAAWAPAIRTAGFTFTPPKLVVVLGQSPSSPCNFADTEAYYCGGTIYIDAEYDITAEDPDVNRAWMAFLIAHEYGHHVQALTGILIAHYRLGEKLNGVDVQLQEDRRVELQADCFSGAYLGADRATIPIDDEWLEVWADLYSTLSDPANDHGSGEHRRHWSLTGFTAAGPGACNTYTAASSLLG
ncbi:neutral zinc metallopeptidase [Kribbella pittospori]|uniref:neutral zinc metallopeptidase n=1 Tax=Kribbella pittospori TaxID=722689 RepID=UPI0013F3F3E2|nr:neutral zinc metallopeptidase [Kribbella pittospori]